MPPVVVAAAGEQAQAATEQLLAVLQKVPDLVQVYAPALAPAPAPAPAAASDPERVLIVAEQGDAAMQDVGEGEKPAPAKPANKNSLYHPDGLLRGFFGSNLGGHRELWDFFAAQDPIQYARYSAACAAAMHWCHDFACSGAQSAVHTAAESGQEGLLVRCVMEQWGLEFVWETTADEGSIETTTITARKGKIFDFAHGSAPSLVLRSTDKAVRRAFYRQLEEAGLEHDSTKDTITARKPQGHGPPSLNKALSVLVRYSRCPCSQVLSHCSAR
jgi:hypothetical protein